MSTDYIARLARVDLDRETCRVVEVEGSRLRRHIGGVGLAARLLWEETSSDTYPFSPDNRLTFMAGPLTGRVPQRSRTLVCALSPANNGWGESAMGGTWGAELANTGLSGVVISGRARRPVYLYIADDDISIRDASHLWGLDTFAAHDRLRLETDEKASVAAIGRAGERQVRIAGIIGDGRFGRAAARCGLGGVMGSKNLKAVVVRGTRKPGAADEARLKALSQEITALLHRIRSGALGPLMTDPRDVAAMLNRFGTLGVKNQSRGRWDGFVETVRKSFPPGRHYHCRLCPVSCVESHVAEEGRLQVMHMLVSAGSNCGIDDVEALQRGYELCNRYGIDTISFGYALSFAMECFEKRLITLADTGGVDLSWGNHEAMLEIARQIGENEGFGRVLAQGTLRAAREIGEDALQYAVQVKGLEMPYWDLRIFNSLALGYATGNRGASHFESPAHIVERRRPEALFGMDLAELGYPRGLNRLGWEHKADLTRKIQDVVCLINSLVVCQFSYHIYGVRLHSYLDMLNAVTGWDMDFAEFLRAGERIFNLKRLINLRRGLRGQDDTLPPRVLQKLPDVGDEEQSVPTDLAGLLREYYAGRGWDANGAPTPEKLRELKLL